VRSVFSPSAFGFLVVTLLATAVTPADAAGACEGVTVVGRPGWLPPTC
jgi:hypothetical protein